MCIEIDHLAEYGYNEYLFLLPYLYFSYPHVLCIDSAIRGHEGSDKLWKSPQQWQRFFHSLPNAYVFCSPPFTVTDSLVTTTNAQKFLEMP